MKPALLYLCHRIPYPPNKGDKIRSYHLLRYLCQHYRVFLGAFIDDKKDWEYVGKLEAECSGCHFQPLDPASARLKSLVGLVRGQALTLPYYASGEMRDWVKDVVDQQEISRVIVYSSAMAQYVMPNLPQLPRRVIDFVDIDSDKWRQYADKKAWPMSWVYAREAEKLLAYEKTVAGVFNASLFVSSAEAEMFKTMIGSSMEQIGFYNNGVDTDYFAPSTRFSNPYPDAARVVVFTGAMDYWPNIDAVRWFAGEVLPVIESRFPDLRFYIVGSNPADSVKKLAEHPRIEVTGRVDDIRPYLQYASVAVAPMRIARGIQNKVLEAMSMEKAVIVSDQGFEGIHAEPEKEILLANSAREVTERISEILDGRYDSMGQAARTRVIRDFSWEENLPIVSQWLEKAG